MSEITIVRGDKNFILAFTIYDSDNLAVDLNSVSSIKLKYKDYENGIVKAINGTVIDPTGGKADFLVGSEFVELTGEFKAEIEITYVSGQVITAPNIYLKIIPDLK